MSADTAPAPELHVVDKLRQIPVIQSACSTSVGVYQKVKSSNDLINKALGSAEGAATLAMAVAAPITQKFQGPIQYVDDTLCKGIDVLQDKVPCVKDEPQQMVENAKNYVSRSAAVGVGKMQSLTNAGYEKANEVLSSTTVGNMTLNGLDTTSEFANRVIDYYLPAGADELNVNPHPNTQCEDKVAHAAHTVGALTYKASTRLYNTVTRRHRSIADAKDHQSDDDAASVHSSDEEN